MPLDVKIRWNSTFLMLVVALKYKDAINIYVKQYMKDTLTDEDEELIELYRELLEPFYAETLNVFRKGRPTLSAVVLIMQELENHLEKFAKGMSLHSNKALKGHRFFAFRSSRARICCQEYAEKHAVLVGQS